MSRTPEQKAKHAAYMRQYYLDHPGYKSAADAKHRHRYLAKIRSREKYRSLLPEVKAQKLAWQRKMRIEKKGEVQEYHRNYYLQNKDKWVKSRNSPASKAYQSAYSRKHSLKRRHGMTLEQYDAILSAQGGVCAICSEPPTIGFNKRLHVDHDHVTQVRRGLLCMHCNHALERMEKYSDWHVKASAYLKRPR